MKKIILASLLITLTSMTLYAGNTTNDYAVNWFSAKHHYMRAIYSYYFYNDSGELIPVNYIFEDTHNRIWAAISKSVARFDEGEWIIYQTDKKIDYITEVAGKVLFVNHESGEKYTFFDNEIVVDSSAPLKMNEKPLEDILYYSVESNIPFNDKSIRIIYEYIDSNKKGWQATEEIGLLFNNLKEKDFKIKTPDNKLILNILDNIQNLHPRSVFQAFFGEGYFTRWKTTLEIKQFCNAHTIIAMKVNEPLSFNHHCYMASIDKNGYIIDTKKIDAVTDIQSDKLGFVFDQTKHLDWHLQCYYRSFFVLDDDGKFQEPDRYQTKELTRRWLNNDHQLFQAIYDKNTQTALKLISETNNIQGFDVKKHRSALFIAAYHNNIEVIEALIKKGVKIANDDLLLCWPLLKQNYKLLDYFLRHGANPSLRGPAIAGYASALVDISMDQNDSKAIDMMLKYNLEFDYVSIRRLAIKMPEYYYEKINPDLLIQELSASSYLTESFDKNMYHPVKVFDGKEDTGWIENATGFGKGEYIGCVFEKPIIVDKIVILPGWFDERYWKQNHRIKKMNIKLDGYFLTEEFPDEMKPQIIEFQNLVVFQEAKFYIDDVYDSSKWDDTAIAEIQFLYNGKKLDIDISKFSEFLKVMP